MSDLVISEGNSSGLIGLYPSGYYIVQSILMGITGLTLLISPVPSSTFISGIISLYLFLLGVTSAISVISNKSDMGYKFLIGIFGIVVTEVSMYYLFNNIFSITETDFLLFLTIMCFIIGTVQVMMGFYRQDLSVCSVGVITIILGIILIPYLYVKLWWVPVVAGLILIIGSFGSYRLIPGIKQASLCTVEQ